MRASDAQAFRLAVGRIGRRLRQLYLTGSSEPPLAPLELSLLVWLRQEKSASPGEVARAERVTPQAVAIAIRGLIERGFVVRARQATDRRRAVVTITPDGAAYLRSRDDAVAEPLAAALRTALTPEERANLPVVVDLLERIAVAL